MALQIKVQTLTNEEKQRPVENDGTERENKVASGRSSGCGMRVSAARAQMKEYLLNSTLHGLRYVAESQHALERLWWGALTLCSVAACSYLVMGTVQNWLDEPVVTSVSSVPISDMEFPSVSVCPKSWEVKKYTNSVNSQIYHSCFLDPF